tara:strand:+ start:367 stop:702 length:336 start_codon:yes stop_codon:yes gene_type:complete
MAVYVANLQIESGTDFEHLFSLGDNDNNTTLNLAGFTATSQLRKWSGSTNYVAFASTVSSALDGEIQISMASTVTTDLKPGRYLYDIVLNDGFSKVKVVEGMVNVRAGVTR